MMWKKIYVDSIYKVIPLEISDLQKLKEDLDLVTEIFGTDFYINVEYSLEDMPEDLRENCIELGDN